MTKEQAQKWLEKVVENIKIANKLACAYEDEGLLGCWSIREIHIYNGLDKLAEALGLQVETEYRDDEEYPYQKFFKFRGLKCFELIRAEELAQDDDKR